MYLTEDGRLAFRPLKYPADEIKLQLGGRWNENDKCYYLPNIAMSVLKCVEWYGEGILAMTDQEIIDMYELPWGFRGFEAHPDLEAKAHNHPKWHLLYPFQQEAVEYLVCNPHQGDLLGLSPGLGKTPVSVVAMDILECEKILITAPLTLAKNWGKEIDHWSCYDRDWGRATAEDKDPQHDLTITNFETLYFIVLVDEDEVEYDELNFPWVRNSREVKKWIESGPTRKNPKTGKKEWVRQRTTRVRPSYGDITWDLFGSDESIMLKNRKAVKVELVGDLAKYSHQAWLLSGSATAKFRSDLYPQMKIIAPKSFTAYWRFAEFFCVVDKGQWGWNIVSDRPDHNPQKYLKDFYFVRNQKDVLPDLPDYIYDPIEIDLLPEQKKAFRQMLDEWVVALEAGEDEPVPEGEEDLIAASRLAQQIRMLQITSNLCNLSKGAGKAMPSVSAKEELLVDLIRQGDIEFPLLVWSWFKPTTESIDARLEKEFKDLRVTFVHGELTADEKDLGIEMFKSGDVDVLVLQMGVGKFGHTLTDTKTVYYHDRTFESDAWIQTLRRVRRIGLQHRPRLIVPRASESADELVELNLAGKMQSIASVASHDLAELLRSIGGIAWAMHNYNTGHEEEEL